jgi:hypothetical protein
MGSMPPPPRRAVHARAASWLAIALLSLALSELVLRWLFAMPWVARRLDWRGPTATIIANVSCYREIRDHDSHDCAPYSSRGTPIDPRLGWTNRPGDTSFAYRMQHVSAQRLREAREFPLEKPPGRTRVEIFGDSFAFGSEAEDDVTYAALLGRELRGAEVMNFGVPGYGLDQMLLRFREEGIAFQPDVVVVGFVSLLRDRFGPITFWYKPYFTVRGDDLVVHGIPVPTLEQAAEGLPGLRLFDLGRMVRESVAPNTTDEPMTRVVLGHFLREIRAAGAKPVLVLYPLPREFETGSAASGLFRAVCSDPDLLCVDTCAAFTDATRRGVPLTSGAHWNPAGHRIVADALLGALGKLVAPEASPGAPRAPP